MAMLIAFLVLSSESYLATYTLSCFELSQGFSVPRRFAFCSRSATWPRCAVPYSTVFGHRMLLFDLGGAIAAAAWLAMAIGVTVRHTAQLYRQEPLP